MGVTIRTFYASGKIPLFIEHLNKRKIGYIREIRQLYSKEKYIPLVPLVLMFFNVNRAYKKSLGKKIMFDGSSNGTWSRVAVIED